MISFTTIIRLVQHLSVNVVKRVQHFKIILVTIVVNESGKPNWKKSIFCFLQKFYNEPKTRFAENFMDW